MNLQMARDKAKSVIADIVRQSPGDRLEGKMRLFKAFYFSHVYFAREATRASLTGWPIVKMPMGPGIDKAEELLSELERDGVISIESVNVGPYPSFRYTYNKSGGLELTEAEKKAVQAAVEFVENKNGSQLSDITHEHSHAWQDANVGDELNVFLDVLTDSEFDDLNEKHAEFEAIWNG